MFAHRRPSCHKSNLPVYDRIREILNSGNSFFEEKVFESHVLSEARIEEERLILEIGVENLTNIQVGSKSRKVSKETREKLCLSWTNDRKENQARCAKKVGSMPKTEEHRRKISESRKGRAVSNETREKLSLAARGKLKSQETKAKMSAANQLRRGLFLSFLSAGL